MECKIIHRLQHKTTIALVGVMYLVTGSESWMVAYNCLTSTELGACGSCISKQVYEAEQNGTREDAYRAPHGIFCCKQ